MDDAERNKEARFPPEPPEGTLKVNRSTPAAKFNAKILSQMMSRLKDNPEVDITTLVPSFYAQHRRLLSTTNPRKPKRGRSPPPRDTRSLLKVTDEPFILSPLSDEVQIVLDQILAEGVSDEEVAHVTSDDGSDEGNEDNEGGSLHIIDEKCESQSRLVGDEKSENEGMHQGFTEALLELLDRSEVIFRYPYGFSTMILRITDNVVAKVIREVDNTTEYSALEYLRDNAPDIPAPRPHGLIRTGRYLLMFSSFVPGEDLHKVWPGLDGPQKHDISSQIETIFTRLRSIPRPPNMPLGGVKGEGCKDQRRDVRRSAKPIYNLEEFQDFVFSHHTSGTDMYIWFMKSFIPSKDQDKEMKCVFTHGDLRTANIKVERAEGSGGYKVTGIVDWEYSGFYPEFWESFKITNTMMAFEDSDWYQHLPRSLSPLNYPNRWLLDRIWDRLVA